jgi:putative membrane protein
MMNQERLKVYIFVNICGALDVNDLLYSVSTFFMQTIAAILTGLVAIEHIYILWLEMFAWETRGRKVFKGSLSPELFIPTKTLAANQGLYNGFLAAGLIWSFFIENPVWKTNVAIFFLGCVIVAGIYGAITASKKIFFVQALPAIIALVFTLLKNY